MTSQCREYPSSTSRWRLHSTCREAWDHRPRRRSIAVHGIAASYRRRKVPDRQRPVSTGAPPLTFLSETVHRALSPHIEAAIGDRRSGPAFIVQIVHREHAPFRTRLQDTEFAALAQRVDLIIAR